MDISSKLVSQFVELTKDDKEIEESTVYGTTVKRDGNIYVQIDGSELLTPVVTTAELEEDERVAVMIKNHTAVVTGNLSNPGASVGTTESIKSDVETVGGEITIMGTVIADKVSTETLEANVATINNLIAKKATIEELNVLNAYIKNLNVETLKADVAEIGTAIINKAEIGELNAAKADINELTTNIANINTLIGGNLTMDNIQSLALTTSKVTVDNAFVKNAMIDSISANKLTAGVINTGFIDIESDDGALLLSGSLQQFKDENGKVRIQMGKDANGDFSFAIFDETGTGQIMDQNGIKAAGIGDNIIVNDMVAPNANISGDKLDIESVVTNINDSSSSIKASSVKFDGENQTLDVAFNNMTTTVNGMNNDINTASTNISTANGKIEALISDTTIVNSQGQVVKMKDDYASFKMEVDGFSSSLGSLTTEVEGSIRTTVVQYCKSTSSTSANGTWVETTPPWTSGYYIWQRLKYIDNKGTVTYGAPTCIQGIAGVDGADGTDGAKGDKGDKGDTGATGATGATGPKGDTGVGISSVVEHYAVSSSNSTAPSSWVATPPAMTESNKYLWNYETITYTNGDSVSTNKRVIGAYGDKGLTGNVGSTGATGATGPTGATGVGVDSITEYYQASTNNTTAPTTWVTTPPGISASKKYLWNYTKFVYTDGSHISSKPMVIGVYGDKGDTGATGATGATGPAGQNGATGATGAVGQSVSSVTPQFYKHTSATSEPGSVTWSDTCPAYQSGKYLWIRNKVIFANPAATKYTTPYYDASWDAKATADATKTTVTSKLSDFTQTLDGFETTVSSITNTVDNLEDNISSVSTRVAAAENKITPSAIVSTVTQSSNWTTMNNNVVTAQSTANSALNKTTPTAIINSVKSTEDWEELQGDITTAQSTANSAMSKLTKESLTTTIGSHYTTSSQVDDKISESVDVLEERIETAESKVTSSAIVNTITSSSSWTTQTNNISTAQSTANTAKTNAATAQTTANTAKTNAATAQTTANSAMSKLTKESLTTTIGSHYTTSSQVDSQITSKGYQTESQVQQTVDELEIKFKSSGGYNMVRNTAYTQEFAHWTRDGDANFVIYKPTTEPCYVIMNQSSTNQYYWQEITGLTIGETYIASCCVHCDAGVTGGLQVYNDGDYMYARSTITGVWEYISVVFTAKKTSVTLRLGRGGWTSGAGIIRTREAMITRGTIEKAWSPHPNEIYDGITSIDKDGIKISMSNGEGDQGYTMVNYEGITTYDKSSNKKAWFGDDDTAYIKQLETDKLINPHILQNGTTRGRPTSYYIAPTSTGDGTGRDASNKSNSINHTLSWIRNNYGVYSDGQDISINVASGTYSEDIQVKGWLGSGNLVFIFNNAAKWYGSHTIESNTMTVWWHGRDSYVWDTTNTGCQFIHRGSTDQLFQTKNTTMYLNGIRAVKEGWSGTVPTYTDYGKKMINAEHNARVNVHNCDIVGYWYLIRNSMSIININKCRGHVGCLAQNADGGYISSGNSIPLIGNAISNINGAIYVEGTTTQSNSLHQPKATSSSETVTPPTVTTSWQWTEKTFTLTNLRTIPEGSGSTTSGKTGEWGQGNWGSYKAHRGYADLGDAPAAWCSGGRNFTVTLTMTRSSSSHGYAGDSPQPQIKKPDGTYQDTNVGYARGATKSITLYSTTAAAIADGTMKTLTMWAGQSTTNYSFYHTATIKIKCEKQI